MKIYRSYALLRWLS